MRSKDFIDALYKAGWDSTADGQHSGAIKLWAELFPSVAHAENELWDLNEDDLLLAYMDGEHMIESDYPTSPSYNLP